jgi:hypothetical protein
MAALAFFQPTIESEIGYSQAVKNGILFVKVVGFSGLNCRSSVRNNDPLRSEKTKALL